MRVHREERDGERAPREVGEPGELGGGRRGRGLMHGVAEGREWGEKLERVIGGWMGGV